MRRTLALGLTLAAAVPTLALARMVRPMEPERVAFQLQGAPIGGSKVANATPAYLTASRIAAADKGAVVIDADSGALIKTDAAGKNIGQIMIGRDAGLLAYDPQAQRAYVADRRGDRVAVVQLAGAPEIAATWKTPAEPYAVALTPDKKTVLVSTIADRTLVAYDAATGAEKWRTPLGREPRGLAVSPDGTRALVAYLATGTVDQIDLLETHRAEHVALATTFTPRRARTDEGDSFARASFTVTFLGDRQAIVPFQRETPVQRSDGSERTGSYGGGFEPPVTHQLAFLGFGKGHTNQVTASILPHQPRAVAWDQARDALYVAGLGSDDIVQVRNASQVSIALGSLTSLSPVSRDRKLGCGPDGLAVAADGDLLVWCSFSRSVARVDVVDTKASVAATATIVHGPSLIASAYTEKQHEGMVLFHSANPAISQQGALACATCHPDNRADGLSWRIDKHELQTPLIAGRMVGTHPFKWDGGDATLKDSLAGTMKRLGGFGLDKAQTEALVAYVEHLPTVRTPTRDTAAVARGKSLFDDKAGCRTCHDGAKYTDQDKHKFTGTLAQADTPSLLGLAASAPYYHDGSAATLEALLRDRGSVHGMTDTSKLSDKEIGDLVAFLETL